MNERKMCYPLLDEKREKRIGLSTERLLYGESEYFFSPKFKRSSEILEGVIRGYVSKKKIKIFSEPELVVYFDFKKKKIQSKIKELIQKLKNEIQISEKDVLGFFQNGNFGVLLTSEYVFSDYGRDNYSGDNEDPKGLYLKCRLIDATIRDGNTIIDGDGEEYCFNCEFSSGFIGLFEELKDLNREVCAINNTHPLSKEKRDMRENYIGILVDKTLADGSLSSNEVVRLEILSRQIGIDSFTVINMIKSALERYEKCNEPRQYINDSLIKMQKIAKEYYGMLYHDVITFELLSNKGVVVEQFSDFSNMLAKRCLIKEDFLNEYRSSMQKLVVSSYSLRNALHKNGNIVENQDAILNMCESVEYEYNLQKELLK